MKRSSASLLLSSLFGILALVAATLPDAGATTLVRLSMPDMVDAADAIVIGEARGAEPLVRRKPFVGQDGDFTPVFVDRSVALGLYATHVLPDTGEDFFLVLAYPPDEYPGLPGISIYGVFGEVAAPGDTQSYYSLDGGLTWSLEPGFEYGFGLVVAPL